MGSAVDGVNNLGGLEKEVLNYNTNAPQLKVGKEIINHNYFFEYFGALMNSEDETNLRTQLYNRCISMYDKLNSAAQRSREGDHSVSVLGFNGNSYKFYENAIVQIAGLVQLYGLSSLNIKFKAEDLNAIDLGYKFDSIPADTTLETKSRETLIGVLDKLDEIYKNVEKKDVKPSFLYRTLGKPGTLYEFFDKAGKQKQNVTITVGCNPTPTSFVYNYFIELKTGNTSFVINDLSVGKYVPDVNQKRNKLESDLVIQARTIQTILNVMGLESKLLSGNGDVISPNYSHIQQAYSHLVATA